MARPIFPIFRERAPLLEFFRQKVGVTPEKLTETQRELAQEFRRGIAEALGVPPEAIREEMVQRWIIGFTKAFVKPEYWAEVAPTTRQIRELGRQIGEIVMSALPARERLHLEVRRQETKEEKRERRRREEPELYSSLSPVIS